MNSFRRLMIGWSSNLILVFFRGSILGLLLAFAISVHKKQSLSEWLFIPFCIGIGCSIGAIMESRNKKPNAPADRAAVADTVKSVVGASGSRWPKYGAPFDEPLSMDEGDVAAHLNSANH